MNIKIKTPIIVVLMAAVVMWVLSYIPFNHRINREIEAQIYENGHAVSETKVYIDGEKSSYLFRGKDSFYGRFHISSFEKSGRSGNNALISWNLSKFNIQEIIYNHHYRRFPSVETIGAILINEEMTDFALMLTDGSVIATSEELCRLYTNHISYDSDTGSTNYKVADDIPIIE